jgi:hypothetical protein
MIYCEKIKDYVDQDDVCVKTCCFFFNYAEDSCIKEEKPNKEDTNVKNSI